MAQLKRLAIEAYSTAGRGTVLALEAANQGGRHL